jgi:hypothetical protein
MDEKEIFEACFSLAESLMWEKNTAPLDKIPEQMDELSSMTEEFMVIVRENIYLIEELANRQEIMVGAIKYLNGLAIPPLRGNYYWFKYSLITILEIANPYSDPGKQGLTFLLAARDGLDQMINWASHTDEEV